jgi:hypothetical protein
VVVTCNGEHPSEVDDLLVSVGEDIGVDRRSRTDRDAKEASKAFGGKMSAREYREFAQTRVMPDGQPWPKSQETLEHALGVRTWNEALRKVGLPVCLDTAGRRPTPVEPCLRVVRELTKRLGRTPSEREYDEVALRRGIILSNALQKRFGRRWQKVLEAAGVDLG